MGKERPAGGRVAGRLAWSAKLKVRQKQRSCWCERSSSEGEMKDAGENRGQVGRLGAIFLGDVTRAQGEVGSRGVRGHSDREVRV